VVSSCYEVDYVLLRLLYRKIVLFIPLANTALRLPANTGRHNTTTALQKVRGHLF